MRNLLIVGATSAIAHEAAKRFAADGDRFFLVARHEDKLGAVADDLRVRGAAGVECFLLDVNELAQHVPMLDAAQRALGVMDVLLVAHGTLPDQAACERDSAHALHEFHTNATATLALLTEAANRFEAQGHGTIAVIASVAGDRGRRSNYLYGAAKAAVSTFTAGLRARLHPNVAVVTIKPGLIDTPMTAHLRKGPLFASAERAGAGVYDAIRRRRDVVYVPGFWQPIMFALRAVPEALFKRLNLAAE